MLINIISGVMSVFKKEQLKRLFLIAFLLLSQKSLSSLDDYIYGKRQPTYSNYGTIGLIQMPSARFFESGTIGFNWTSSDPYYKGSIMAYPFDWFEASYHYTDINNALYSDVRSFSGNQTYKDKGFDLKLRILKEATLIPELAIGIRDIAGTGTFAAEYFVASKFISNISIVFLDEFFIVIIVLLFRSLSVVPFTDINVLICTVSLNFNASSIENNVFTL